MVAAMASARLHRLDGVDAAASRATSDRFDVPRRPSTTSTEDSGTLEGPWGPAPGRAVGDREIDERAAAIERGEYLSDEENEHVALPSPDKKPAAGSPEARSMRNFDKEAEDALKSIKYDLSPRSKKRCQAEADGFRAAARPDDARLYVMRHRAAFHDLLLLVGRVNAYRQRAGGPQGPAHEARPGEAPMQRRAGLLA